MIERAERTEAHRHRWIGAIRCECGRLAPGLAECPSCGGIGPVWGETICCGHRLQIAVQGKAGRKLQEVK